MILGIYKKTHINVKNRICSYSNNLMELGKLETENLLIDEKNYKDLLTYFINYVNSNKNNLKC